jgi:transcriptional regulator with XRE-family HTH domain
MTTKWYDRADALLKQRRMSRADVGRALGLTSQAVSLKLSGQRPTSVDEIGLIAGVIGVSVGELVEGDESFLTSLDEVELVKLFRMMTAEQKASVLNMFRVMMGVEAKT